MADAVPLVGMLAFLLFAVVLRALFARVRHGTFGVMLFRNAGIQRLRDLCLVLLVATFLAQAAVSAAAPERLRTLTPVPAFPWPGAVTMLAGLILLLIAQSNLGPAWRIGIDPRSRPGLATTGLYRFCRNPIFAALILFFLGYVVALPTWISIGWWIAAVVGIRAQILDEERWLTSAYGDAYRSYAARVGRFLPSLGRLR